MVVVQPESTTVVMPVVAVHYSSNYLWWQWISAVMPVIMTAVRKLPLGVHIYIEWKSQSASQHTILEHGKVVWVLLYIGYDHIHAADMKHWNGGRKEGTRRRDRRKKRIYFPCSLPLFPLPLSFSSPPG